MRIIRISIIVIGIVVAPYASSVRADEYRDATDAAYCVGVYEHDVEMMRRLGLGNDRGLELKAFPKIEFVKGAIKQGQIDEVTASKMKSDGYADAGLCETGSNKCMKEYRERESKKVDVEQNKKQKEACDNVNVKPACDRAYKNCD